MKTLSYISLLICISVFTALKNKDAITDYRNNYIGNYVCIRSYTHPNDEQTALVTESYTTAITVQKSTSDSILIIGTKEGSFTLKMKNATLINTKSGGAVDGKFFATDSILIAIKPGRGPFSYKYLGKKQ